MKIPETICIKSKKKILLLHDSIKMITFGEKATSFFKFEMSPGNINYREPQKGSSHGLKYFFKIISIIYNTFRIGSFSTLE